jgi:hypothetical protein
MNAAFTALGIALLIMVGNSGHVPGAAEAPPDTGDCQVSVIAEEGTPRLDPQKLCDALKRAEQEAGQR